MLGSGCTLINDVFVKNSTLQKKKNSTLLWFIMLEASAILNCLCSFSIENA